MARPINRLSARAVATRTAPGYIADGGGLYLQISETGSKAWVFRYERQGRRREMGLGSAAIVTLQEARAAALEQRRVLISGKDPVTERKIARSLESPRTWGECADAYIESHKAGWKNAEQAAQWEHSLTHYGPSRSMPVAHVATATVMDCLLPIWTTKTETATRVRGRIERVIDWARVSGYRDGENPARWRGHLDKLLPRPSKLKRKRHFPAMPYGELPAFMAKLRERSELSAQALTFTILTAARTNEITGATWHEFSGDLWTIPGARMKAGVEHVVPLVPEAIEILERRRKGAQPFKLSENGMLYFLQKSMGITGATVHGFRSSFRDWASETTQFQSEVIEMALAHTIQDKTEAAYRRGNLLAKRRELMQAWAAYLIPPAPIEEPRPPRRHRTRTAA
ncbi:MAG TPA: integrase arm-type DNA-binding domain-containing protein [Lysobacter sp.]